MPYEVNIEKKVIYIGMAVNLLIPVIDQVTGEPKDLTGMALKWQMRNLKSDTAIVLAKATPPITIINNGTAVASYAKIPIYPTDTWTSGTNTILVAAGKYYHGIMRVDAGNEILLAEGYCWVDIAGVR